MQSCPDRRSIRRHRRIDCFIGRGRGSAGRLPHLSWSGRRRRRSVGAENSGHGYGISCVAAGLLRGRPTTSPNDLAAGRPNSEERLLCQPITRRDFPEGMEGSTTLTEPCAKSRKTYEIYHAGLPERALSSCASCHRKPARLGWRQPTTDRSALSTTSAPPLAQR